MLRVDDGIDKYYEIGPKLGSGQPSVVCVIALVLRQRQRQRQRQLTALDFGSRTSNPFSAAIALIERPRA